MGDELERVTVGRAGEHLFRRGEDVAAESPGAARLSRRHLDRVDLGEEVGELGIRLALDRHAAEVADIALVVAAGIEGEDVALAPDLARRRPVVRGAGGNQAVLEGEAAQDLLAAKRFGQLELGRARAVAGDDGKHRIDDALRGFAEEVELGRRLHRPQPLERHDRIDNRGRGERLPQRLFGIRRQKRPLDADAGAGLAEPADVVGRRCDRPDRAPNLVEARRPELAEGLFVALHRIAEIGGLPRLAAHIDQDGEVAGEADRVEMVEEEEAVAAEEILDVVLGSDDEDVDPGGVKKLIQPVGVERQRRGARGRSGKRRVHGFPPSWVCPLPAGTIRSCCDRVEKDDGEEP